MVTSVAVIGLGYVGKTIATLISQNKDFVVTGFDNNGYLCRDINNEGLGFIATHEEADIANKDIYVICVPTPESSGIPNDHYLIAAAKAVERSAKAGALVIVESTVPIGTMDYELGPIFARAGLDAVYSPERINPGDDIHTLSNTPKLLSGMTPKAIARGKEFYENFIDTVIVSNNIKSVEAAKILENTYRLINIAFINQFASATRMAGLDPIEIVDLAGTKGFGFEKFIPGPKAGGHCVPVDPVFLQFYLNKSKVKIPMLDSSLEYNAARAKEIVNYVISKTDKPLNEQTIMLIGMTYKPNVNDIRNSAGQDLFSELEKHGATVKWHDDIVHQIISKFSTDISYECDTAIIIVRHDDVDISKINAKTIIDISSGI